jgi:hypothetical protein
MEPPPDDVVRDILAGCDHLDAAGKEQLRGQLNRLVWAGPVDIDADSLLKTAAKVERRSVQNEVDRAIEWLTRRLADGPVGSIIVAKEGDAFLGRRWPPADMPTDKRRPIVLGRAKWWRETILKDKLGGEPQQFGFHGPWFFRLPTHSWPPAADAGIEARKAEAAETEGASPPPFTIRATGTDIPAPTEATATEASAPSVSTVASVDSMASATSSDGWMENGSTEATEATVALFGEEDSVETASVGSDGQPATMWVDGIGAVVPDPHAF